MPYLVINMGKKNQVTKTLSKRITTIGTSKKADIIIDDNSLHPIEAYINQTQGHFQLMIPKGQSPAFIDGKPKKLIELSDSCEFTLSSISFNFFSGELKEQAPGPGDSAKNAYRRLLNFSQNIARESNINTLLKTLLKEITQLTKAEHGFLVLIENEKPTIKVYESPLQTDLDQNGPMSDSIVKKVLKKKEPIILSDALNDQEFSSSLSVINYRLTSVMCTPLIYQGNVFGAIYVANNSFINAFDKDKLEIMTIFSSQAAMLVQNALHIKSLKNRTKKLQESLELTKFGGLIGTCNSMQEVFSQIEKVSNTDISVLIYGENGTGKKLIARELHNRSTRKKCPFEIINCGAIPDHLLESELFGHVRGAFKEANQSRIGKLQANTGGTLLLDEITKLPFHLQNKLFNALKNNTIQKIGSQKIENIDIRILCSTSENIVEKTQKNEFSKDLYYKLNEMQIIAPPLRERGNDVLVLANFYLQKYKEIYGKNIIGLHEQAQNALINYSWPGNIRELENRIRRAVVMCESNKIEVGDLDLNESVASKILPLTDALERYRAKYINDSLERNAGNRTKAANELGVDPRTIFRHLENLKKEKTI